MLNAKFEMSGIKPKIKFKNVASHRMLYMERFDFMKHGHEMFLAAKNVWLYIIDYYYITIREILERYNV